MPMGSINRVTLAISENLRRNCSPEEIEEIEAWVKRYRRIDELKQRHAALTLPEQIAAATAWFKTASEDEARQAAEDVIATTAMLRRALAKRGFI